MKKRWFSFLMALCMCVALIPAGAVSAPDSGGAALLAASDVMPGDIDGDGAVTEYDAALLERYLVGDWKLTWEQEQAADMDGDGSLTKRDLALIRQYTGGGDSEPDSDFGWSFDDGTLYLYGPGDLKYDSKNSPWSEYADKILHLVVDKGVTSIGKEVFYNCDALTDVTFYGDVDSIGEDVFSRCDALTDVTFYGDVDSIGEDAFEYCGTLTSVTFSGHVGSIGESAFEWCHALTGVTFLGDVGSIRAYAFSRCDALTSVTFSGDVGSIGEDAFSHCYALTTFTIPASVTYIRRNVFFSCGNLTDIYYGGSKAQWEKIVTNISDFDGITIHFPKQWFETTAFRR